VVVAERARAEAIQRQNNTFGAVFADWVKDKLAKERQGPDGERDVRKNLPACLGHATNHRDHRSGSADSHQREEAHRAGSGPKPAGQSQRFSHGR